MKAEDQDAGLIFASTTKDRSLNDVRGFQSEVAGWQGRQISKVRRYDSSPSGQTGDSYPIPKAGIGSSPRFAAARAAEAIFERAIQFQRRELVAVLWAETKAAALWGSAAAVELRGGETAVSLKG